MGIFAGGGGIILLITLTKGVCGDVSGGVEAGGGPS